jgi:6-phosphogluconolactonase (cycloisomerase 2 family)
MRRCTHVAPGSNKPTPSEVAMTVTHHTPFHRRLLQLTFAFMLALGLQQAGPAQPARSGEAAALPVARFVYVGNHQSRNVSAFRVEASGALSPILGSPFPLQAAPKSIAASPDGKFLFVASDEAAAIAVYVIGGSGALAEAAGSPFEARGIVRELALDHGGKHLYATGEDGSLFAFAINSSTGRLSAAPAETFPQGAKPFAYALAVGAQDKFLFVSDATANTLTAFALDEPTGALSLSGYPPVSTGLLPGKIAIPASGNEIYVANSGSDSISLFSVDAEHRALAPASPLGTLRSPGDLVATDYGLFVGSAQGAGLAQIATASLAPSAEQIATQGPVALATDPAAHFLFAADAKANQVTRYLLDPQSHKMVAGSALAYPTGATPSAIAIANTAPATTGTISVTLASTSLLTFANTTGSVQISPAATQGSDSSCAGQVIQLAFSVPSIAVISLTSGGAATTSVCVLTGKTTASFYVRTEANSGSSTLTGFATGFTDGTTTLSVSLRTITLSLPYTNIGVGNTVTGTVTLANPAPTGGVTIALTSSASQTASVSAATTPATIPANGTTATYTVTGVQANTATLSAKVASGGYSSPTLGVTVFPPGRTISLPHNVVVAPGQALPYPISIGAAATAPVSINLTTSGGPGTATFSPNPVVIATGATTATSTITGGHIGPLSVTGSATGFASDIQTATVQITLTFNPNTLSVETGTIGNLTLSASSVAPTGGFTINLASANPAFATVPGTILIPARSSTVTVPVTGVNAGTTTVTASAPGAIAAVATITVYAQPKITLTGPSGSSAFTIGNNAIVTMSGSLAVAAPKTNLAVALTTPASSSLLLSTTATALGSHSITVTVPAGSTSLPTFYAQATAASGTAVVTAAATAYSNGTATASFTPSGFIVLGGTSTTTLAGTSPVTVYFAQLAPTSLALVTESTLRPGLAAITVGLKNTDTPARVGTLGSSSIVFNSGNSSRQTTFQPVAGGTAVIGFSGTPAGYSTSSTDATTTFTVTKPNSSISFCNGSYITGSGATSLGYNSVCTATAQLATPAPVGGRTVTLTSSNSADVLLSTSASTVGAASIALNIAEGGSSGPTFYVQSLKSSGSATITESVPGYNSTTATVNFTPSGFIVLGGTSTTTFSGTSPVTVYFAQLATTTRALVTEVALRPGLAPITVGLTNTDTPAGVGTLGSNSIVFKSGDTSHQTTFQPAAAGTAVIGFSSTLAGYATPSNDATTTFTVTAPNSSISFCNGSYITGTGATSLGYNSVCSATPQVATPAPAGGRTVTLTSSNAADLLLSTSATTVGVASITLNIPAGSSSAPTFYVQSLKSSGSATITESVPGYNSTTATVNFTPSGFIVLGGTSTSTVSGTSPVTVYFAQLAPTTRALVTESTLRPGLAAITVGLTTRDTPAGVGTLGSSSIVFNSGDTSHQTTFQPSAAGTAVIGFSSTLAGYATPSNDATTTFTVSAPNSSISFCNGSYITGSGSTSLGYNSVCNATLQLADPAPAVGRTVTLTSSNPKALLLSTSATTVGTASIAVNIAAGGSSAPTVYVQSLTSTGSATITETVPGYNSTTATVNFTPSGFIVLGGTSTTTLAGTSPVTVYFAQLNPTTLALTTESTLRPGLAAITVGLTIRDTPAGVGTLGSNTIVFKSGDTSHQTTFQPAAAGTAVIGFSSTLAGFATPSNDATATFTVTAPNSSISFCNGSYITGSGSTSLGYNSVCSATAQLADPAPAGGRTVTLTSSNAAALLLSTSATTVGMASISVNVAAGSSSAPTFYVQSLKSSGSATITETVPGYNSTTATVNFTPSGFIVLGGTSTTTLSGTSPVTVYFAQLAPTTLALVTESTLRPGLAAITVGLTNTDTPAGVGTLGSNSIVFNSGDTSHQTTLKPAVAGTAVIGFSSTLAGYSKPSTDATTTFTVTAPSLTMVPITIGNYLQATTYVYLGAAAPAAGAKVTITAPSSILLSSSAATKGTGSISFTLTDGESSTPSFYVQSQGGGAGSVNLTISAPLYATGTGVVTVYPSGLALQGSNFTTTLGDNPTTLTIVPAALDPQYLNIYAVQELIPNLPMPVTGTLHVTPEPAGSTPAGTLSVSSVTFKGDDNPNFLTSSFEPKAVGTALITITSPTGFSNASTQITATVDN